MPKISKGVILGLHLYFIRNIKAYEKRQMGTRVKGSILGALFYVI
jgi:hypothetical protein